jgi:hypothetical protein
MSVYSLSFCIVRAFAYNYDCLSIALGLNHHYHCDNRLYRTRCKMYYYQTHATRVAIIAWSKALLYDIKILLFHHNVVAGCRRPIHNNIISLNACPLYVYYDIAERDFDFRSIIQYGKRVHIRKKTASRTSEKTAKRNINGFVIICACTYLKE